MNKEKKCFKCLLVKPLDEFHRHVGCADKHLNKCKECTKKDVKKNRENNLDYYKEYDRKRGNYRGKRILKEFYINSQKGKYENVVYKTFKGEKKEYRMLHKWVEKMLGKPDECTSCKKNNLYGHKIHWANISGEYKQEISDWVRLCAYCHKKYDLLEIN